MHVVDFLLSLLDRGECYKIEIRIMFDDRRSFVLISIEEEYSCYAKGSQSVLRFSVSLACNEEMGTYA